MDGLAKRCVPILTGRCLGGCSDPDARLRHPSGAFGRRLRGVITFTLLASAAQPVVAQQISAGGEQQANRLEKDIVVTGTRSERLRRDSPVRTDVIGDVILEQAAPRSLADALEYLPGARAESNCQNCNTTEIQLLGLPGAYNQILFDGLPLLSGVAAVYGLEQVPALLIERIEVVKGGASALYGPGAVAGVVNVISRPIGQTGVRAVLGYERPEGGDYLLASAAGSYALGDQGSGVSVFGTYVEAAPVDYDGDGFTELVDHRLVTGGARALLALGARSTLGLDYQHVDESRRGGNRLDLPAFLANIAEEIKTRVHRGSASFTQEIGDDSRLAAVYAFAHVDRQSFYGGLGQVETDPNAPGFDEAALEEAIAVSRTQYGTTDNLLQFAELRGETTIGPHALIAGVQYRHESVEDLNVDVDGRVLGTLANDRFDDLGLFVQDEWSLSDSVRLLLGGRIDWSSELDDPIVSPRVGLWYSPSAEWVLRANYSTGFRAPEVFSEDLHIDTLGGTPIRVRNAAGLVEESSQSWAAGFDWRPDWRGGALTIDGQAYYTTLRDTFFLGDIVEAQDGTLFRLRTNAGGSTITGAEINASYRHSDWLQGSIGVAYTHAEYDEPQLVLEEGDLALFTRDYLKSADWTAVAQIVTQPFERTDTFLGLRYIGGMDVLNNRTGRIVETPPFLVVDLSATVHFPVTRTGDLDLTFGVKNLLDERQQDLEVGAARDSDFVYGPRLPRTVFVRIDAHF